MTPSTYDATPLLQNRLSDSARRYGDKVALVYAGDRVTYAELEARSNALANSLVRAGLERGDRVLIFADNSVEAIVSFWAALKANGVASIVSSQIKEGKLSYLLGDCQPTALITSQHLYPVFAGPAASCGHLKRVVVTGTIDDARLTAIPTAIRWEDALAEGDPATPPMRRTIDLDLASIIYTSGSTGDPKGVMLTHRNMLTACESISAYLELADDDIILCALPLAFDYGLYQMIMAFRAGARLVLERSFAFPAQILNVIAREGVTGFPGVPTIFSMLSDVPSFNSANLPSIRYITNTAAALSLTHLQMLQQRFPAARIYSMYGLTECKRCTYLPPRDLERKPQSVGIPIPNTEMWIVDENGFKVGPGVVGQLVIRGATVMKGYWEKPEETARKLKPGPLPGEFVLHTGDFCTMDEEGYLYFVARMDEVIKSRGEKVAPKEVENALLSIPGVKEAAVIGVPDELLGQAVKAFVVLEPGVVLAEKQLQLECQARLESFMVPKFIVVVTDLPKTDTGKIKKLTLS